MTGKKAAIISFVLFIFGLFSLTGFAIRLVMLKTQSNIDPKDVDASLMMTGYVIVSIASFVILDIIALVFYFIAMVKTGSSAARILMIIGLFFQLLAFIGLIIAMAEKTNVNKTRTYINNGNYCSSCGQLLQKNNQTIQNQQINTQQEATIIREVIHVSGNDVNPE